ncbi:MAG: hypothetical protein JNK02_06345 [Planctomycetes bacterium]|nr:hypothetical protein [Planctomycetota bacterium]
MSAEHLVRALCARHGLPDEAGTPFLPLVRKALLATDTTRERILRLVDEALADRADAVANGTRDAAGDDRVLMAVARVLHPWTPSEGILDLGSTLDRHHGEGA